MTRKLTFGLFMQFIQCPRVFTFALIFYVFYIGARESWIMDTVSARYATHFIKLFGILSLNSTEIDEHVQQICGIKDNRSSVKLTVNATNLMTDSTID